MAVFFAIALAATAIPWRPVVAIAAWILLALASVCWLLAPNKSKSVGVHVMDSEGIKFNKTTIRNTEKAFDVERSKDVESTSMDIDADTDR